MLKFKQLYLQNFQSVGAGGETIDLTGPGFVHILGDNRDAGKPEARNAAGKTTILNALHYALYDSAFRKISKANLINFLNNKNMLVTLDFEAGDKHYRIERGRKPNLLRFYVNDKEQEQAATDEAQGENRHTQKVIEEIIGMPSDIFKQLVILNSKSIPFLEMAEKPQREFIESLFNIGVLTEKAERLKEMRKDTGELLAREEADLQATMAANDQVTEMVASLTRKSREFEEDRTRRIAELERKIAELEALDTEAEIAAHALKEEWRKKTGELQRWATEWEQAKTKITKHEQTIAESKEAVAKLKLIDIDKELQAWKIKSDLESAKNARNAAEQELKRLESEAARLGEDIQQLFADLEQIKTAVCPECGQSLPEEQKQEKLDGRTADIESKGTKYEALQGEIKTAGEKLESLPEAGTAPETVYGSAEDAYGHNKNIEIFQARMDAVAPELEEARKTHEAAGEKIAEIGMPGDEPETSYAEIAQAYDHDGKLKKAKADLEDLKTAENPHTAGIAETEARIQVVDRSRRDELSRLHDHQDYLIRLLTDKRGSVRTRIIQQNISLLNVKLAEYLDRLGLANTVKFEPNLSVDITRYGRSMDFANLSRGEETRLILGLSWAFRDTWEMLRQPVNLLLIDEMIDSGLDSSGGMDTLQVLEGFAEAGRSVFLISHKTEIQDIATNILTAIKEDGFTRYELSDAVGG